MTQAGRQGSPRNSSGRNSSERNSGQGSGTRNAAQGGAGRNPAQGGSGRPSAAGGGFRAGAGKRNAGFGGGDRPYKAPKPREEPFVDPGDAPASPAGRGDSDWKPAAASSRKPAARKPGAKKAPGTPGALKPKPRAGKPGPQPHVLLAANASARTLAQCASLPANADPAVPFRSLKCTTPTAPACRRSWPRRAWRRAASARK